MIDLETLGVEPDSVIVTLGAIKFNPFSDVEPDKGLYLRGDIEEQSEKYNRTIISFIYRFKCFNNVCFNIIFLYRIYYCKW